MARERIQHKDMCPRQALNLIQEPSTALKANRFDNAPSHGESPVQWSANGTPLSRHFPDHYRSVLSCKEASGSEHSVQDLGLNQSREVFLKGAGLTGDAPLWNYKEHWNILETGFGLGLNFLSTWALWRSLPERERPNRLTFVSIEQYPVLPEDLLQSVAPWPELSPLAEQLKAQWFGLVPGFHRLRFEHGSITLVLCVGDIQSALDQLQMRADSVFLDGFNPQVNPQMWTHKVLGHIAKFAHTGTRLATWCVATQVLKSLQIHGFNCQKKTGLPPKRHRLEAVFTTQARQVNKDLIHSGLIQTNVSRTNSDLTQRTKRGQCAVIGAGLAGACAAYSMAQRGWSVTVFDCAPKPAQSASGVPLGIVSTQLSADDNVAAKLSRTGLRHTQHLLEEVLPFGVGVDWEMRGVLEIRASKGLGSKEVEEKNEKSDPDFSEKPKPIKKRISDPRTFEIFQTPAGSDWCELQGAELASARNQQSPQPHSTPANPNVWHKRSGWVIPSTLINAILSRSGIKFCGSTRITQIRRCTSSTETQNSWLLQGVKTFDSESNSESNSASNSGSPPAHDLLNDDDLALKIWDHVIVANAKGASELLEPLLQDYTDQSRSVPTDLESTYGQLTWGSLPSSAYTELPSFPVNGEGSFMIRPTNDPATKRWYAGSTFERLGADSSTNDQLSPSPAQIVKRNQSNLFKLKALYPPAFEAINDYLKLNKNNKKNSTIEAVNAWGQYRCNTRNRLPWTQHFGSLFKPKIDSQPKNLDGLSVLTGFGSKGLVLAPLCAEIIACTIHQEPSPLERNLEKSLIKIKS